MAPHPLKKLHPSLRFRSGDTKIGKILFPALVTLATAYITYQLCVVIVSYTGQDVVEADLAALNDLAKLATTSVVTAGAGTALTADLPSRSSTTGAVAIPRQTSGGSSERPKPYGIHTMCTSNGSPYLNWQTRIMYKTYQKARALPCVRALSSASVRTHLRGEFAARYLVYIIRMHGRAFRYAGRANSLSL